MDTQDLQNLTDKELVQLASSLKNNAGRTKIGSALYSYVVSGKLTKPHRTTLINFCSKQFNQKKQHGNINTKNPS